MIKLLQERRTGISVDWLLPTVYATHKWTQLALSHNTNIQRTHDKGVTCLNLETNTNR